MIHLRSFFATLVLLAVVQRASADPPPPHALNPLLRTFDGSCASLLAPCPAADHFAMHVALHLQYLRMPDPAQPVAVGASADVTFDMFKRVSAGFAVPLALVQPAEQGLSFIGGPLDIHLKVRLGPASPPFYRDEPRPLLSGVLQLRSYLFLSHFDGDPSYGAHQGNIFQPALLGGLELAWWRLRLRPGAGIVAAGRDTHALLSFGAELRLLKDLWIEGAGQRLQALAVPDGLCQSAWQGGLQARWEAAAGTFFQIGYLAGAGGCVPTHAGSLTMIFAYGPGLRYMSPARDNPLVKRWQALLLGLVDPILDCNGWMLADDGTPMFNFGNPDKDDPHVIWRGSTRYAVGEHFWVRKETGELFRDGDTATPIMRIPATPPAAAMAIYELPACSFGPERKALALCRHLDEGVLDQVAADLGALGAQIGMKVFNLMQDEKCGKGLSPAEKAELIARLLSMFRPGGGIGATMAGAGPGHSATHHEEPPQLAAGKRAHREEPILPGEKAEVPTPSGRRMDRYNEEQAHIREIKPNNPRQIRAGQTQVDAYRKEMEQKTGRPHTTEVTPYDAAKYR